MIVEADQTSGVAKLENLPRGYYTVTEVEADGYTIQAFEVDGQTDCENSKSDTSKSLTFRLGYDTDKNNVIKNYTYKQTDGGVKGVASYTNEAVTKLDLKKTDTENHLLTGSEFNLEIKKRLRGYVLLSQAVAHQVPSPLKSLTSVFGMGTGVSSLL